MGALPAAFALAAGIGDMAIGMTAPLVHKHLLPSLEERRTTFLLWNVAGVLDLLIVLAVGILASPDVNLAGAGTTARLMTQFPWSLVPTFLAPLFIILHLVAAATPRRKAVLVTP